MRPQLQRFRGAPGDVESGDCHRTCIAMILDLDRDEVPHFMEGVPMSMDHMHDSPEHVAAENAERAWLAERGLTPVYVAYPGSVPLSDLLAVMSMTIRDAAVILGCTSSNGTNHSVVYYRGRIYNPNTNIVTGPMNDGMWWVTVYAKATNPLPTAPEPASVVNLEDSPHGD